jgi:hypothetical protein
MEGQAWQAIKEEKLLKMPYRNSILIFSGDMETSPVANWPCPAPAGALRWPAASPHSSFGSWRPIVRRQTNLLLAPSLRRC